MVERALILLRMLNMVQREREKEIKTREKGFFILIHLKKHGLLITSEYILKKEKKKKKKKKEKRKKKEDWKEDLSMDLVLNFYWYT